MSIGYWDNNDTTTTTGPGYGDPWYSDTGSTSTSTTATPYYFNTVRVVTKQILVTEPDHWSEDDSDAFINLVNNHTDTGWKVTLRMRGDIEIIDPDIDVRTMEQFIPLFKSKAHHHDVVKINEFFVEHPVQPEETK